MYRSLFALVVLVGLSAISTGCGNCHHGHRGFIAGYRPPVCASIDYGPAYYGGRGDCGPVFVSSRGGYCPPTYGGGGYYQQPVYGSNGVQQNRVAAVRGVFTKNGVTFDPGTGPVTPDVIYQNRDYGPQQYRQSQGRQLVGNTLTQSGMSGAFITPQVINQMPKAAHYRR